MQFEFPEVANRLLAKLPRSLLRALSMHKFPSACISKNLHDNLSEQLTRILQSSFSKDLNSTLVIRQLEGV